MALDGDFKGEQARKEQAFHDRLRKADEALKAAIAERIKIGAEAARVELSDFATWIPESPPTYNVFTGRRMTASERKECIDAPFLCETYLCYLMGRKTRERSWRCSTPYAAFWASRGLPRAPGAVVPRQGSGAKAPDRPSRPSARVCHRQGPYSLRRVV